MATKWTLDNVKKLSNLYYNSGLEKAKEKDFTAAAEALEKSVRLDGSNINARNLLGLIYYQTGSFSEALVQWVVSDQLQKEDNLASYFLVEVQKSPTEFHNMETAIMRYNRAIVFVEEGSDDLAIMQLKKAVDLYPMFIKAYQLMALLYIRRRSYSRAERVLNRALRYDAYNPDTTKYLTELRVINIKRQHRGSSDRELWNWEEEAFRHISGDEVIKPHRVTNLRVSWNSSIFFVLGIILTAIIFFRAVIPAKTQELNDQINHLTVNTQEEINTWRTAAQGLQTSVDDLTEDNQNLEQNVGDTQTLSAQVRGYTGLINVLNERAANDPASACLALTQIDTEGIPETDTVFWNEYNAQKNELMPQADELLTNAGVSLADSDRERSNTFLRAALEVNEDNVRAMFQLGLNAQAAGEEAEAFNWFNTIVTEYPSNELAAQANAILNPPAPDEGDPQE